MAAKANLWVTRNNFTKFQASKLVSFPHALGGRIKSKEQIYPKISQACPPILSEHPLVSGERIMNFLPFVILQKM